MTTEDRFWAKVDRRQGAECWPWRGHIQRSGYGMFSFKEHGEQRAVMAHRLAYEFERGAIPNGHHLHHTCQMPTCVNPAHLEPITTAEHAKRGKFATRTCCSRGHAYTPENTRIQSGGRRVCRACHRMRSEGWRKRMRSIEPFSPVSYQRTWGTEQLIARTSAYIGKVLYYRAGEAGGLQYHTEKTETFFLFSGEAWVYFDKQGALEKTKMLPGMSFHIPCYAPHKFEAITDCVVFEASVPVFDDRVRVEHAYGLPEDGGLPTTK